MASGLSDKVALVTGGGSGIGRAVVEGFVGESMKVGVLEISPEKIEELEELGSNVKAIRGDATALRTISGRCRRRSTPSEGWMPSCAAWGCGTTRPR